MLTTSEFSSHSNNMMLAQILGAAGQGRALLSIAAATYRATSVVYPRISSPRPEAVAVS